MCLCFCCGGVGGVGGSYCVAWAWIWQGRVMLCLSALRVWIICVDGRNRYMYIVLDGYLRILGAPSVKSCGTLSRSAS